MIRTHQTRYLVSAIGISTSYEYVSSYVVRALVGPLFILLVKQYFLDCAKSFFFSVFPQVSKLCALAHIEVGPESNSAAAAATGLDVAAVQKDVGAMLRCMRTMRGGHDERELREAAGAAAEGGVGAAELERNGHGGPWGGAASWAAPMQEVGVCLARSGKLSEASSTFSGGHCWLVKLVHGMAGRTFVSAVDVIYCFYLFWKQRGGSVARGVALVRGTNAL